MQHCSKKNKKVHIVSLLVFILLGAVFTPTPTHAQSSINQISLSASLFNNENTLINGEFDIRFSIYTTDRITADPFPSTSDTSLWNETQTVFVKNGVFKVFLGSTTPFPATLNFSSGDYYLGIRVATDAEMVPRKKLGAVPNAINSQFLQGRTIGTAAGNIPLLNAKGDIDIKSLPTGSSGKKLLLANDSLLSDIHVQNTDTGTDSEIFNIGSGTALANTNFDLTVSSATATPTLRYNGTTGAWQFSNDGTTFIGISGGVDPDTLDFTEFVDSMTLDASTDVSITGSNIFSLTNTGTGYSFLVNDAASDTTPFVIAANGNVGVGTTSLGAKLSIDASGADTTPLTLKTNGSVGNYTATNSGIFVYDAAGTETLRIVASDPDPAYSNYNTWNLYIGREAGASQPSDNVSAGYGNTGVGYRALASNTTGYENSAFGIRSLEANTTGNDNTAFGAHTLRSNVDGYGNAAFGVAALRVNVSGDANTAMGVYSFYYQTTGNNNTALGNATGYNPSNDIAQYRIIADTDMTLIGYGATKDNASTLTNGIAIGSGAHVLESNQVVLGNDSILSTLLKGDVSVRNSLWANEYRESSNSQYNPASNSLNGHSTGATWIEAGSDVLATGTSGHTSLVYDGKMWMIGGWIGSRTEKVYSSSDGVTWTEVGTDALPVGTNNATSLVYDGKMWLIGGATNSGNTRKVYYSTDGITWTESGTDALPVASAHHSSLVYDGKMWVIGGETAGGDTRKVYYSSNGSSWTEAGTNALPVGTSYHSSLVYDGKMWVIGGWVTTGGTEKVYYSTDGITWTEAGTNALSVDSYSHRSIVYDGKMWVIGGWVEDGSSQTAKVYTSTNGTSWTEVGTDVLPAAISDQGLVVFDGKIWTIAGDNGGNSRKVYYTTPTVSGGLAITTNGSVGNYTAQNSGIFMYDAAGTETLRIVATDPNLNNYNSGNLYIGLQAGASNPYDNSSAGYYNTGVGTQSLYSNTTGDNNSAFGNRSLYLNTTGTYNAAFGDGALYNNISGGSNSAFGGGSLATNTTGDNNVALGSASLYYNVSGTKNVGIGNESGYNPSDWSESRYHVISDTEMTLIGYGATKDNASTLTNGIAIGSGAHVLESNQAVLGNDSITTTLLKGSVGIGTNTPSAKLDISNTSVATGSELITNGSFTGSAAGWTLGSNVAYGTNNVTSTYVGGNPSVSTTFATVAGQTYLLTFTVSGANNPTYYYLTNNTLTYDSSPVKNGTVTFAFQSNYTGTETIVFDDWFYQSGDTWTIDDVSIKQTTLPSPSLQVDGFNGQTWLSLGDDTQGNTGLGISSLQSNTTGYYNTAYGAYSLSTNTTGASNAAFGISALQFNTTGQGNVALGNWAMLSNTTGNNSTATGNLSLYKNTTGFRNTAYGAYSLLNNTTGTYNLALGYQAGMNETEGSGNILIGTATSSASYGQVTTGSNNISIGYNVAVASPTASNQLNIGNLIYGTGLDGTGATLSSGNIGIGTTGPGEKLDVEGAALIGTGSQQVRLGTASADGAWVYFMNSVLSESFANYALEQNSSGDTILNAASGRFLGFRVANGDVMRITSTGSVGIGDTTPDGLLDIEPTGAVTAASYGINLSNLTTNATTDAINKYGAYITSTGSWTGDAGTATNNYGLYVDTVSGADNNYGAYFAQNVGIGTTSPAYKLHVGTTSEFAALDPDSTGGRLILSKGSSATIAVQKGGASSDVLIFGGGNLNDMYMGINATATSGLLHFRTTGLGINYDGLSVPEYLSVNGNILVGLDTNAGDATGGTIRGGTTINGNPSLGGALTVQSGSSSGSNKFGADLTLIGGASTGNATGGSILFQTTPADASGSSVNTAVTAMTILGSGSVGIGDTTPSYKLEVATDIASDYIANFFNDGNADTRYGIQIQAGADDGSGTTYYLNALDGDGGQVGYIANTAGSFALTDVSDIRTKTNISDTRFTATPLLNEFRVVDFNRKSNEDGPLITGFIAQEVQAIYPNAITENEAGLLGIMKDAFIPLLVKGFQEQNDRITIVEEGLTQVTLQTTENISTLAQLQVSVDDQLIVVGDTLNTINTTIQESQDSTEAHFLENDTHLSDIDTLIESLGEELNTQTARTTLLESQMDTLTDQVSTLIEFYTTFDLSSLVMVDEEGNVEIAGKLKATILQTGGITIEVVDTEAPTIGRGEIKSGDTEVTIETKAVKANSHIIVTPRALTSLPLAVTDVTDEENFTVKIADPATTDISFDWWIIEETPSP